MKAQPLELEGALGHPAADRRIDILRRVGTGGSISQAARDAGISYKAAWQALDTLSNLAGAPLVERAVGGAGGGGARLTPAGAQLLQAADALAQVRGEVMARLDAGGLAPPAGLGLRTSMRNQLPCAVQSLRGRGAALRAVLALPGGEVLAARITRESAQLLGLAVGQPVLALCKATAVAVAGPAAGRRAAGLNLLEGQVTRASRAAGGGEVALALADGLGLVGFAGPGHGLRAGGRAMATVDEAAVVIAVPG